MKKIISFAMALVVLFSVSSTALASDRKAVSSTLDLASSLQNVGAYYLSKDIDMQFTKSIGVGANIDLDGYGHYIESYETGAPATIYQNENVISSFSNLKIVGSQKYDVGIWIGDGLMSIANSTISGYDILSGRYSAIAVANDATLTLDNTKLEKNKKFDLSIYDTATLNITGTTSFSTIRVASNWCSINIGDDWNGSFDITYDSPVAKTIGSVGKNADISGIKVTNDGYYVANDNGSLVLKRSNECALTFDMSKRENLFKGSTGFLYGSAEINVPTIDLLQGLKPNTMVQKAYGGLQHPTGDAVRTSSALLSSGVKDMQIYLQDTYLEWPYDAPMINGSIDLDAYQKTVERILYSMICTSAKATDNGAFKGSDGKYYILNKAVSSQFSYVLFNEPDQIWYGGNFAGLEQAWKRIYNAVHRIDPSARCVGPNYSGFNAQQYDEFFDFCYKNNCLPEIISWHELGDISLTDFYSHYDSVMKNVKKYYPSNKQPQLMVNEYARHYDIGSPGGLVKWLSMFEDKDMCGCMAYWAMANSLNELAADQNSPSSSWWVYHWYAQMTGDQCPLVSPAFDKTRFYGVSSYDKDINMGYILFGGNEDENMSEIVYAKNLDSTDLVNNNAVGVKVYGVKFSGQQGANYSPELVFDGNVAVQDNTLRLEITDTDEMDAFFAILTKGDRNAIPVSMTDVSLDIASYEAENAVLLGSATAYSKIGWATFATSGRADVGSLNKNGDGIQFDINVDADGQYNASIFYSLQAPFVDPKILTPLATGQNRAIGKTLPYGVILDGQRLDDIYLQSTVTWAYKNHCDIPLDLTKGKHTLSFVHINGDESQKGNLQLTAAFDKLDIARAKSNDFDICLDEMQSFKTESGYKVTAVAPVSGYYDITADADVTLSKQIVDYAKDALSTSVCRIYDAPVGSTAYLSQGANTLSVVGDVSVLSFKYNASATDSAVSVVNSTDMTLHGYNPTLKQNAYASSNSVVSNISIGQNVVSGDNGQNNYATFTINADTDGLYNFAIRYTNDEPAPIMKKADGSTYIHPYNIDLVERYAQISVNGTEPETVYFRNTMSWDTFKTVDVQLALKKGSNVIKIYNDNSYQFSSLVNSTAPEIDTMSISRLTFDSTKVALTSKPAKQTHSFSTSKVTKSPTCTSNGTRIYYCSSCSATKAEAIKATGHKPIIDKAVPATYAKAGKTEGSHCSVCKVVIKKQNTVAKLKVPTATISKLTATKKGFKVQWKKNTKVSGYQIRYSTSSKMSKAKNVTISKNSTTSKSITKLSAKKKYFVQIRTYKTVSGKKYYSTWSKTKIVTTKK